LTGAFVLRAACKNSRESALMVSTPKALRLHIALFGRTNVGKSTFLNLVAGQAVSITSRQPGTTTDVVEKSMELLPLGPVVFLDTAGLDDRSELGRKRVRGTHRALDRADVAIMVLEAGNLSQSEREFASRIARRDIPLIAVINKADRNAPIASFLGEVKSLTPHIIVCSSLNPADRARLLGKLKTALLAVCPDAFIAPPPLVGDLLPTGGVLLLIVPLDLEAPKGRLILPQVQTIRDALDYGATILLTKDDAITSTLDRTKSPPDLVVCDSQVVVRMISDIPPRLRCTTFSILFARIKGDLWKLAAGAAAIDDLTDGDRVLIAESCSHHPVEDDIGRVKIPRWLREYTGANLSFSVYAGRDFPEDITAYRLIVQCGGCMCNRREMLTRIESAEAAGVPITNYGICISKTRGVLDRVLSPFQTALDRECDAVASRDRAYVHAGEKG